MKIPKAARETHFQRGSIDVDSDLEPVSYKSPTLSLLVTVGRQQGLSAPGRCRRRTDLMYVLFLMPGQGPVLPLHPVKSAHFLYALHVSALIFLG